MRSLLWMTCFLLIAPIAVAQDVKPFRFKANESGQGKLTYFGDIPVLILQGSPEEMGEQAGVLVVSQVGPLLKFPRDNFRYEATLMLRDSFPNMPAKDIAAMEEKLWPKAQKIALKLVNNFPKSQRDELEAMIKAGMADRQQLLAANGIFDLENISPTALLFGCSSLLIPPQQSATGGVLFGRNLDFSHFGYLHQYSLLTVYRSTDKSKRAFVSAGFPGLVGCFTGMNDAGLTIASHSVQDPVTKKTFREDGVPFAMAYRRVLEECETVDEAIKLLEGMKRASLTNLAVADTKGAVVIEVSPTALAVRRFGNNPGVCTNHFCSKDEGFENPKQTNSFLTKTRFETLTNSVTRGDKLGVSDVKKRLHEVKLVDDRTPGIKEELTIQTFVFEPGERKVHLRFGNGKDPASAGELTTIDLKKLWGK